MIRSPNVNPVRSCLGCGRRAPQNELLRVFVSDTGVVDADPDRRRFGRGAYLCWKVECVWEARKKNRFSRALHKRTGPGLDDAGLSDRIAERLRERMLRRLHTARRAGAAMPYPMSAAQPLTCAPEDVRAVVVPDGAEVPAGLTGTLVVAGGSRERLALALQSPQATHALLLDGALARELAGLAQVREDFLRTPPIRPQGRSARAGEAKKTGMFGDSAGGEPRGPHGGQGGPGQAPKQSVRVGAA